MTDKQSLALDVIARVAKKDRGAIKPEQELVGDLGLDSPKQLHLLMELEEKLHVEIGDDEAARLSTVADVLAFIATRS